MTNTPEITRETPHITMDGRTYFVLERAGAQIVLERRIGRPLALASTQVAERVLAGLTQSALAAAALLMFVAGSVA